MILANPKGLELTERERDTIIAALRYWQRSDSAETEAESAIATNGGERDSLQVNEIDALLERLNHA